MAYSISLIERNRPVFERNFVFLDGEYYFTLKDREWMLPITENSYWKTDAWFSRLSRIAFFLNFVVVMAGLGYAWYQSEISEFTWNLLWWPAAAFLAGTMIHIWSLTLPCMAMLRSLESAMRLSIEERAKFMRLRSDAGLD